MLAETQPLCEAGPFWTLLVLVSCEEHPHNGLLRDIFPHLFF